jgi:hypothetical protein
MYLQQAVLLMVQQIHSILLKANRLLIANSLKRIVRVINLMLLLTQIIPKIKY